MTGRINAEGLPTPSPHMGAGEAYLHRMCQLLDQISAQLDRAERGEVPDFAVVRTTTVPELVAEPAEPKPTARKAAADAPTRARKTGRTGATPTTGKDA